MPKIKKLSIHEAQKIAAGEVVERPANVVKELLENALDACATMVTVHVEDAGRRLIRVVDNGCGMSVEDALICFDQYATSKIVSVNDLPTLQTFGFRGEALASIAAVSKITLLTKEASADVGTKVTVACNAVTSHEAVACNEGTDIAIEDLFYNVPARKKFLKSNDTEWRAITQLMHAVAFAYKHVHFKVFHNNRLVYNCPPTENIATRIAQVWDTHAANALIPVQYKEPTKQTGDAITLSGMISHHHYLRYDRSNMFFLVNSRWVKNTKLSQAVMKGYGNALPSGKFPACVLSIEIDAEQIDVNIHPRKEEVAFLHPRTVEVAITAAIQQSLEVGVSEGLKKTITMHPQWHMPPLPRMPEHITLPPQSPMVAISAPMSWENKVNHKPLSQENVHAAPVARVVNNVATTEYPENTQENTAQQTALTPLQAPTFDIVGQYHTTYILLETDEGLMLMDQHAAHERILYEKFLANFEHVAVVGKLFPDIIPLSAADVALIEPYLPLIRKHGIVAETFGTDQLIITATPITAQTVACDDLIRHVIGWISELNTVDEQQFAKKLHEKIHAQMACKAAVKAGDILSREQMTQLVSDLFATNNRFACPHGRPTTWLVSLHEIEKKFRRKL